MRANCVRVFVTPWTAAHHTSLFMEFSRQEYWNGLPFPTPWYLLNPGNKPVSLVSPALTGGLLASQLGLYGFLYLCIDIFNSFRKFLAIIFQTLILLYFLYLYLMVLQLIIIYNLILLLLFWYFSYFVSVLNYGYLAYLPLIYSHFTSVKSAFKSIHKVFNFSCIF